jgi:hypothetical protein
MRGTKNQGMLLAVAAMRVSSQRMYIYVINLDRCEDRMVEFGHVNSHMPEIQRFSAIDGQTIDRQKLV